MKNMKIKTKTMIPMIILIIMVGITGIGGMASTSTIMDASTEMNQVHFKMSASWKN